MLQAVWTTWRREKSRLYRGSNSDPSAVQTAASRYSGSMIGEEVTFTLGSSPLLTEKLRQHWTVKRGSINLGICT